MRQPSQYKTRIHFRSLEDPRVPLCKSKIYDFPWTEDFMQLDCLKCKMIIKAMYLNQTKGQFMPDLEEIPKPNEPLFVNFVHDPWPVCPTN